MPETMARLTAVSRNENGEGAKMKFRGQKLQENKQ